MTFPSDIGVIDLMMGVPEGHKKDWYGFLRAGLMDDESKEMEFPVEYMFKGVPDDIDETADPVAVVLGEMDHFGIDKAMLGVSFERGTSLRASSRTTTNRSQVHRCTKSFLLTNDKRAKACTHSTSPSV